MWPFKRKEKREIWTETAISLYERQVAAREALGDRYLCHPKNDSPKLHRIKFMGVEFIMEEHKIPEPPGGVLQNATHYQDGTPILRVVK